MAAPTYLVEEGKISLSRYNREEEIDTAVEVVSRSVERLRSISPYGPEQAETRPEPRGGRSGETEASTR